MGNKIKITNIESFLLDNVLKQVKERKKKKKEKRKHVLCVQLGQLLKTKKS